MSIVYTSEQAAQECVNAGTAELRFFRPCKTVIEKKITIRAIQLKGAAYYQVETFKNNQAFQQNIAPAAIFNVIKDCFCRFRSAECRGQKEKLFFLQNNKGVIALTKRIPLAQPAAANAEKDRNHNKVKNYLIPEGQPLAFLTEQGVMNAEGFVLKQKYHKFRQINKFLEFIAGVEPFIRERIAETDMPFSITDFGCGKAYLSFALYYYLHERQGLPVRVHGLDLKTEVITHCTTLAERCGYTDLTFAEGNIADYPLPADTGMMVCLHACNTATDLALAQAVRQKVPVIFAVPCCQHELYGQLKDKKEVLREERHLLLPFMEHGIITERFASLLTDTIRALLLQAHGYTVHIMEFIETEHTPKNILIHAVKKTQNTEQAARLRQEALQKYRTIKESFCIEPMLETLLSEPSKNSRR
ncbi:MAG: class I SAM-dependent methyltransferase [Treponema sp.]|uniref:class I SAM-dependent methyltransferase n=1 Tax=Treponema sp. TaxID=166 RepID=UPI003FA24C72